ncbi:23S rRNA (uracil(1939)-C(5))-methyltransferase RlmD [Lactovum miscens]|uniref:23S rRNA (Uracil1939-C5)-methyltransferase n=1 Tax=Lactovum miscens TaxID=190387 RepID=A0A841C4D5_9LACT|nr:23S rRNA (uracil(1939)-C(5))-methyltransferase RlmD [Lactovum miscens]MBB5888786.1 23S rRNA (uracil1939-C5)-methyltransferase [Lactovum miscens]
MKKNESFEVEVLDLTHEGMGVVRVDNFPFFVENALVGERIRFKIVKIGKNFGFGKVEEILRKSPFRVESNDLDFLRTGIADISHLEYSEQLKFKKKQVETVLSKSGIEFAVEDPIAAKNITAYRNKAQIPVRNYKGQLETGFFRKNSHNLIPIEDFYIQDKVIDQLIVAVRDQLRKENLTAFNEVSGKGLVRNIVIRRAHKTGEIMLILVVSKSIKVNFDKLIATFPDIKSIQLSIKTDKGNAIFGKKFELLAGQKFITDELLGKKFEISAQSFYQVNSEQAEILYQVAYNYADLKPSDIIIDAYSGIGTVGICVADKVAKVYGMEVIPEAIDNANLNSKLNHVDNAHYVVGTAEDVIAKWLAKGIKPDVIFVDPPRKGLDEAFIKASSKSEPRCIVYISCNPATLARDVVRFQELGYYLKKVQPVDLFPQTHHVEVIIMMTYCGREGK